MMTEVAMVFEESLLFSYQKRIQAAYDWAAERVGEARKSDEFIRLRSKIPHAGADKARPLTHTPHTGPGLLRAFTRL